MQIGASLPVGDIGTGPSVIRDHGQAGEGLGFDYIITSGYSYQGSLILTCFTGEKFVNGQKRFAPWYAYHKGTATPPVVNFSRPSRAPVGRCGRPVIHSSYTT